MKNLIPDPYGRGPDDIIALLQECIDPGGNGETYNFKATPKNERFIETYVINEDERINILRRLTPNHYKGWDYSNNERYPNDIVYIFHYRCKLFRKGSEKPKESVKIYIKITLSEEQGKKLIIISFHD